jgi:hypothetical protein
MAYQSQQQHSKARQNGETAGSSPVTSAAATVVPDGLEVAVGPHPGHDGPQLHHLPVDAGKVENGYYQQHPIYQYGATGKTPLWKQKKWIAVGAIIVLLIVAVAVVGGVLGSRLNEKGSPTGPSSSSSSTTGSGGGGLPDGAGVKTTSVKPGSKLAAAGYWNGNDYGVQVFYERKEGGNLAYSRFENVFGAWTPPIDLGKVAKDGTGMAACVFYLLHDTVRVPPATSMPA